MATVNCNVRTPWNDTKCHRFAGTGYNEFYSHITTVEKVGSQSEKNGKHEVSHTSSDDYNGYLPTVPDIDDYAMDTNDAGAENSMENGRDPKNDSCMSALIHTSDLNENVRSVGITLGRRKRSNDERNTTAEPKRQRHEGNLIKFLKKSVLVRQFLLSIFACSDGFSLGAVNGKKKRG
jgi:hypothetical protein